MLYCRVAVSTEWIGGEAGSIVTMAFTRFGRESAVSHPGVPPWEWVSKITGEPMASSNATSARCVSSSWLTGTPPPRNCTCVLAKVSKTGSPIMPVPGN